MIIIPWQVRPDTRMKNAEFIDNIHLTVSYFLLLIVLIFPLPL